MVVYLRFKPSKDHYKPTHGDVIIAFLLKVSNPLRITTNPYVAVN